MKRRQSIYRRVRRASSIIPTEGKKNSINWNFQCTRWLCQTILTFRFSKKQIKEQNMVLEIKFLDRETEKKQCNKLNMASNNLQYAVRASFFPLVLWKNTTAIQHICAQSPRNRESRIMNCVGVPQHTRTQHTHTRMHAITLKPIYKWQDCVLIRSFRVECLNQQ